MIKEYFFFKCDLTLSPSPLNTERSHCLQTGSLPWNSAILTAWVISFFTLSLKIPSKTNESPNFSALTKSKRRNFYHRTVKIISFDNTAK